MDQANLRSVSVVAVEGDVILVDAEGNSRALNSGEFVGSGDVVVTPAQGSFSLNTDNNQPHTVAGDSAVFFSFDPLEGGLVLAEVDVEDQSDAIDYIQQLIVEGRNPTELLENPAAGEPVLSSGFSPFINIPRSTRFVLAEAGYDTSVGEFSDPAVEILFEEDVLRNIQDTTAPGETDGSIPVVSIPEAVDGINAAELVDGAQAEVTLPAGTEAGDTVTLAITKPDGSTEEISHEVTPEEVTAGSDAAPRHMLLENIQIPAGGSVEISYIARVSAGALPGEKVNRALLVNGSGDAISNIAEATVRVGEDPILDQLTMIGKVFNDINGDGRQDAGENGMPHVNIVSLEGLIITTDKYGRFHIPGVSAGPLDRGRNFFLKLDESTLPSGYEMTTENPRVLRITAGLMTRMNFGVRRAQQAAPDESDEIFFNITIPPDPERIQP